MRELNTAPLTPVFGVEISDLQLRDIRTQAEFDLIRAAFETHSVLLFRNQEISDSEHMALARRFGPIEDRLADERKEGEPYEVPKVSNVTKDGTLSDEMDLHSLQLKSNMLWHADSTFMPTPALANILIGRVVTETGGATELASTRAAFADMPPARQETLRAQCFTHHYAHSRARLSPELAAQPMFHKWPAQTWPAVWKNPVTGQEAVYVASHAFAVDGESGEGAQVYLDDLIAFCTQPHYVYAHRWSVGDVLIWDQRAVLHRGTPWPYDQPRTLSSLCVSLQDKDGLATQRGKVL